VRGTANRKRPIASAHTAECATDSADDRASVTCGEKAEPWGFGARWIRSTHPLQTVRADRLRATQDSDHGRFVLEPLGPQYNEADHAAWTSSIEHIRATPGYPDGDWPPIDGMSLEANLADLRRHAADFAARKGFTFTVLDPVDADVIGCVYLYPPEREGDVIVQSWVRADRADLDEPLADAVAAWIATEWPWQQPDRCGR
jgi:hypothetical protein